MALVTAFHVLGRWLKYWKVRDVVKETKITLENRKASYDLIRFILGILSFKSVFNVFDQR